jgi:hypothetical protein
MSDEHPPEPPVADLAAATPEEIAEVLSYALRFDERGKPRRGGWDLTAALAAERLTDHLRRSGLQTMLAPDALHRTDADADVPGDRPAVQWVVSPGAAVCVAATTRSSTSVPSGGMRAGRVLSRSRPGTPSAMNRLANATRTSCSCRCGE